MRARILLFCLALLSLVRPLSAAEQRYEFKARVQPASRLVIEASGDIEVIRPLIVAFQSDHPDIHVIYGDSLTNELFDRLQTTCNGTGPMADFVFSSSVDHMVRLANDGCAAAHRSAETARIPDYDRWRDEVFGFSFEPAVIVYNRQKVPAADIPRNRDQLIDLIRRKPETYAGRIGTYDIAASGIGYLFGFYDAEQSSAFGRLIEALGRADARRFCCTGALLSSIESGEVLIGYNLLGSYAARRMAEGAPIGIVLPSDYTLVLSRAAFLPARAQNPGNGQLFLDFLLSEKGQKVAAESFHFSQQGPLPAGVEAPEGADLHGVFRPIPISPSLILVTDRQKRRHFLEQWQQAFGIE